MKTLIIIAILSMHATASYAMETDDVKIQWLKDHAHSIHSVRLQDNDDFADLAPLANALKGVRVVALGESTHGDGTTMLMKGRLLRFLHQECGFDVMIWESGMMDVRLAESALHNKDILPEVAAGKGIYSIWTASEQLLPVWEYIRETQKTTRPIRLAGYDCKFTGYSGGGSPAKNFITYIKSFFGKVQLEGVTQVDWDRLEDACRKMQRPLEGTTEAYNPKLYDEEFIDRLQKSLESERDTFRRFWSDQEIDFAAQMLRSLTYIERYMRDCYSTGTFVSNPEAFLRDQGMGLNLLWCVEKMYPNRKIIVWAHNSHIMNTQEDLKPGADIRVKPMKGSSFAPVKYVLGAKAYSLGFLSYKGKFNYPNISDMRTMEDIPAQPEGSLQDLCMRTQNPLFFVDMRTLPSEHWLTKPISAGFSFHGKTFDGYEGWSTKHWNKVFDGFIFIRDMEPSTTLRRIRTLYISPSHISTTGVKSHL